MNGLSCYQVKILEVVFYEQLNTPRVHSSTAFLSTHTQNFQSQKVLVFEPESTRTWS